MATPSPDLEAFRAEPELQATASHIVTLQRKLDRLEVLKRDAWAQLLASVYRQYEDHLCEDDLMDLLDDMGASFGKGYTLFWDQHMPAHLAFRKVQAEANRIRQWKAHGRAHAPNAPAGTWAGTIPCGADQPTPRRGTAVVYVLFDATNEPAYVGSTEDFRTRMKTHRREKPGLVRWMAYRCTDREAAYVLEDRLLKEHKPRLNRKRGR